MQYTLTYLVLGIICHLDLIQRVEDHVLVISKYCPFSYKGHARGPGLHPKTTLYDRKQAEKGQKSQEKGGLCPQPEFPHQPHSIKDLSSGLSNPEPMLDKNGHTGRVQSSRWPDT